MQLGGPIAGRLTKRPGFDFRKSQVSTLTTPNSADLRQLIPQAEKETFLNPVHFPHIWSAVSQEQEIRAVKNQTHNFLVIWQQF